MARRPLAARAAPPFEVAVARVELAPPHAPSHVLAAPGVAVAAVAIAPQVATVASDALGLAVTTRTRPLAPAVAVAASPLDVAAETTTGAGVPLLAGPLGAVPLAFATTSTPRVAAIPVRPSVAASLERVADIRLERGDAGALGSERLRALLTRLWRASGTASPAELVLVGVYPRAPGGAIARIGQRPDGSVIARVVPGRRARPTLLAVARRRSDDALVSVEDG